MIRTLHFLLPICCLPFSLAADVAQTPQLLVSHPYKDISMTCEHNDTSKYTKLWYKQKMGKELVLMGLTNYQEKAQMEKEFTDERFNIKPEKTEKSVLTIRNVIAEDNAVYYCASSMGSGYETQYFGEGTILSVLGEGEEEKDPKVKVFPPNKNELQVHHLISLVCIATGFFPEHVRLTWYVNDVEKKDLYQNVPIKKLDGTYSTSKRLSLTRSEYFNPDSTFKCRAAFIGKEDKAVFDEIKGEQDCGVSKESFAMMINQGKISYIMVLFKSAVYALIVLAIIWRKKVLSGSC